MHIEPRHSIDATPSLNDVINSMALKHEATLVKGKTSNAVLISEADWRNIQETIYLTSIPGMAKSIHEGLQEPDDNCFSRDECENDFRKKD
jgi:antitoxin YefM